MCLFLLSGEAPAAEKAGNRLTYLDGSDPYYVSTGFPRLTTPQWVGEDGVEAVVVLAIDDMRDPAKYEEFLRPILQRLKKIDGRAPVSIMTNNVKPDDPRLRQWLDEGLSVEIHTIDHPCPLLQQDDFAKAKSTYDRCVDLMHQIPGNKPVAFRMPCCDSLNTVSPRFFAEIFNRTTPQGHFLTIDSSVFNVFTAADASIPRELLVDPDGKAKFKKYVPADRSFVNTIENYPYPYIINGMCWEFPCVAPSDWSAQHYHNEKCAPATVRDWKAALDITVLKQGVMNLVFHPHGWIRNDQIVELIDHAVEKHGKKVKFLTFREAHERLNKHVLGSTPLRDDQGRGSGIHLVDFNNDGYLDVLGDFDLQDVVRVWSAKSKTWSDIAPPRLTVQFGPPIFGAIQKHGAVSIFDDPGTTWRFAEGGWIKSTIAFPGKPRNLHTEWTMHDLDYDGIAELFCDVTDRNDVKTQIFRLSDDGKQWLLLPFSLPQGTPYSHWESVAGGLRFVDINEDGYDDVVFSNDERYSIHLFESMKTGWSKQLLAGVRGKKDPQEELPPIVNKDGTNNGFWVHSRHLWWQNEHTAKLKDLVDRRSFDDLMKNDVPGPKSPEESLKAMVARPGFTVELVASEPLVRDPVAFEWGPDGKLWVVEMADYPVGIDGNGKPGGRIRVLQDTDGDGKYDHAKLFLDGLNFPNGVMPWRNGVLITAAPDIIYAEDTDGDGHADRQEVLYTGFGQGNQQHRVNGLAWGLDNWIYCANGDSGGRIQSVKTGETINIGGRDLRIRPETGQIDPQLGSTQFGRSRDDWGNWFGNNNSNPMWQFVLQDQYLRRNPHVVPHEGRRPVSINPGPSACFPISRTLARFNDLHMLNHFTSACSAIVYRDELFGPEFAGNSFVSEPVHNLLHREVMTADGAAFTSRRADDEKESEFLSSRDNWFRPTMIKTGPDGALYIADMYRKVIEHTQYIPTELQKGLDVRAGDDCGRIYRVFPTGSKLRRVPNLAAMSTVELVAALDSPNGWQRDTVQKLLIQRRDMAAVEPLEALVREGARPLARLHALCTLDGMGRLTASLVTAALADSHPGVRRHAVRLCESFLNVEPEVGKAMLELLDDRDPHVRLQLACSLGEWSNPEASRALGKLALDHSDDRYIMAAVISSTNAGNVAAVLAAAASTTAPTSSEDNALLARMLSLAAAVGNQDVLQQVFTHIAKPRDGRGPLWQYTALADVLDALERRKSSGGQSEALTNFLNEQLQRLNDLFESARASAGEKEA
ncbi:MAG: PVC-type heme-binding CxxCH protein, partial [Planctomycetaceae bacterium]